MNNEEIKEILEELEDCKITKYLNYNLDNKDARIILDYITNLQKDRDDLDDYNRHLHTELTNLQEENERLKDELQRLHNLLNSQAYKDLDDYKSRIDKAIEYIKENQYRLDLDRIKNELLEILGDGNNDKD